MKKTILIASAVLLIMAVGCNRKKFVNKLSGTWSLSRYLYAGADETSFQKDTAMKYYKLVLESNNQYMESWQSVAYQADTIYRNDTLGYDSAVATYIVKHDTIGFIDSTITPHADNGNWQLLNSEQDLQLLDDSDNTVRIYFILKLTGSQLDLQDGNYEMDLSK